MPTPEQLNYVRQRRREKQVQLLALTLGLLSAVVIVAFVIRLIDSGMANERRTRETIERERLAFEAKKVDQSGGGEAIGASSLAGRAVLQQEGPSRDSVREILSPGYARTRLTETSNSRPTLGAPADGGVENLDQKKPAIAGVLREFFEARNLLEMLPLVRDARRVRPMMESYYSRSPVAAKAWKGVGWAIPVEERGFRFAYVQALFEGGTPPVNVVVEETDRGFFVDWESSVQYSELGWKEFIATKPGQPKMFRVLASKAEGDGTGSAGTVLKLKHPQEDGVVIGRFDAKDPRFRPLVEQLDLCKWQDVPVILRLCYPGPSSAHGEVQIAGVEGKGWLILDESSSGS